MNTSYMLTNLTIEVDLRLEEEIRKVDSVEVKWYKEHSEVDIAKEEAHKGLGFLSSHQNSQ